MVLKLVLFIVFWPAGNVTVRETGEGTFKLFEARS